MKKKVRFVAFGDIQIRDWKQHSEDHSRLIDNYGIIKTIARTAREHNAELLFLGDLFDNASNLDNLVLANVFNWFKKFKRNQVYAISGNHDQSERNTLKNTSPSYIKMMSDVFKNWHNLDNTYRDLGDIVIAGVPYMSSNSDMIKSIKRLTKKLKNIDLPKILLLHTHLPGATEPSGLELDSGLSKVFYKLLKPFDLILSGHIHKPQWIYKNTLHLGATHHQRSSDAGCEMGYWLIYEDLSMEFIPLKAPQFIYTEETDYPKDGNFYITISKTEYSDDTKEISANFKPNSKPKTLAKEYLKAKNIKSKKKLKTLEKYLEL